MGRKPIHVPPSKIKAYDREFYLYPEKTVLAYYRYEKYKYSEEMNKQKYIIHIIFPNAVNVSKFYSVLDIQAYVIPIMRNEFTHMSIDNSIVFIICDFQKGFRFWIDSRMIYYLRTTKKQREQELNVSLGYLIGLINPNNKKTLYMIRFIANLIEQNFDKSITSSLIATNLDEAYAAVGVLNKNVY